MDHLNIGGERTELAWLGSQHTSDNIHSHLPKYDTLMLIDIALRDILRHS